MESPLAKPKGPDSPANTRLMIDKDGNEFDVKFDDYDSATKDGLEPAYEFVDPKSGSDVVVKHKDLPHAEKDGLVFKPTYNARQTKIDIGTPEAAARGLANYGTAGWVDEVAGATDAAKRGVKDLVAGRGIDTDAIKGAYRGGRDAYRLADDEAYKQHKLAYLAGGAAGALPGLLATGGAGLAGGIGKAALTGALQGGIGAAGGGTDAEGQADLTKGEIGKFAVQTGAGAALGGVLGAGTDALATKIIPSAAETLQNFANRRAAKVLTGGSSKGQKLAEKLPGGSQDFGKDLLDLGIVSGGKSVKGVQEAAGGVQEETGKKIGDILSQFDKTNSETGKVNVGKDTLDTIMQRIQKEVLDPLDASPATQGLADKVRSTYTDKLADFAQKKASAAPAVPESSGNSALDAIMAKIKGGGSSQNDETASLLNSMKQYSDTGAYKDEAQRLSPWLKTDAGALEDTLAKGVSSAAPDNKPFGFRDLHNERRLLDKLAYTPTGVDKPLNDELQGIRKIFNEELMKGAGNVMADSDPNLVKALQGANRDYSVATTAKKLADEQVSRGEKNRSFSMTDYLSGIAGAAGGGSLLGPMGAVAGAVAPVANKIARERGNQILAGSSKTLADFLRNNPQAIEVLSKLAKQGTVPASFMINNAGK